MAAHYSNMTELQAKDLLISVAGAPWTHNKVLLCETAMAGSYYVASDTPCVFVSNLGIRYMQGSELSHANRATVVAALTGALIKGGVELPWDEEIRLLKSEVRMLKGCISQATPAPEVSGSKTLKLIEQYRMQVGCVSDTGMWHAGVTAIEAGRIYVPDGAKVVCSILAVAVAAGVAQFKYTTKTADSPSWRETHSHLPEECFNLEE